MRARPDRKLRGGHGRLRSRSSGISCRARNAESAQWCAGGRSKEPHSSARKTESGSTFPLVAGETRKAFCLINCSRLSYIRQLNDQRLAREGFCYRRCRLYRQRLRRTIYRKGIARRSIQKRRLSREI